MTMTRQADNKCANDGCEERAKVKGRCMRHYQKRLRDEDPNRGRQYKYPCRACSNYSSGLDYCQPCLRVQDMVRRENWTVTQLEHSVYYRRTFKGAVLRIYAGPTVRWESEGKRFRQGKAQTVFHASRRIMENFKG